MKILSWNIGQYWFYPQPNIALESDFEHISRIVNKENPDLVFFQEVGDKSQVKKLAELIEAKRYLFAPPNEGDNRGNAYDQSAWTHSVHTGWRDCSGPQKGRSVRHGKSK